MVSVIGSIFQVNYKGVQYHSTLEDGRQLITYDKSQPLGQETDGATSFKGKFDQRPVAVKRYVRREGVPEPPEIEIMRYIDIKVPHPNIARYYFVEKLPAYWLIATELGQCSIYDYFKKPLRYIDTFTALDEITQGLNALHSLQIAHRDIRPGSVILSFPDTRGHCRAMIEGFALTKLIPGDDGMSKKHHERRLGWQAPEILHRLQRDIRDPEEGERQRLRRQQEMLAGDIFALGGLFYYALTEGNHPFGNVRKKRDANILSENYQVPFPADKFRGYYGARSLITSMLQREPTNRPKISEVMNHPMFWTKEQILDFVAKVSDRLQTERGDLKWRVNGLLDTICPLPPRGEQTNWITCVDRTLVDQLNKRCGQNNKLNGQSVFDLLRAIRNSKHHHKDSDWPLELKNLFHATKGGFCRYWMNIFPELLLHVWQTLTVLQDDPDFKVYYDGTLRQNPSANAAQ